MTNLHIETYINGPIDMHGNYRGTIYHLGRNAGYISAEPAAWAALVEALEAQDKLLVMQDRIEQQDCDIQAQTRRLRFQHGRIARQELTIQEQGDKIRQLYDEVADLEGLIANYRGDDPVTGRSTDGDVSEDPRPIP